MYCLLNLEHTRTLHFILLNIFIFCYYAVSFFYLEIFWRFLCIHFGSVSIFGIELFGLFVVLSLYAECALSPF